ncbi:MAG: type IV secretion system protein [Legionellales bacterium]|nr:type IV secretion system protein [Legionellales bacterium]
MKSFYFKIKNSIVTRWRLFKLWCLRHQKQRQQTRQQLNQVRSMTSQKNKHSHYFELSATWFDDVLLSVVLSRQRYQRAFLLSMLLALALTIALITMMPLTRTQLVVVHENASGETWVSAPNQKNAPNNVNEVKSNIARFVRYFESYNYTDFNFRFRIVQLLANPSVFEQYQHAQTLSNPNSPIRLLGENGSTQVQHINIEFLDKDGNSALHRPAAFIQASNLALVTFQLISNDGNDHQTITPYSVLIRWHYRGMPQSPFAQLENWRGFEVTEYQRNQTGKMETQTHFSHEVME